MHKELEEVDEARWAYFDDQYESTLDQIARFRYFVFDKQLPFLVTFSAVTVVRVLLCLIGVGFAPTDSLDLQLFEPQVYILIYLVWAIWVAGVWQWYKPFQQIESLELAVYNRLDFEQRAKPWLAPATDEVVPDESRGDTEGDVTDL